MKQVLCAAILVATVATPAVSQAQEWTGNVNAFLSVKALDEDDWKPAEEHGEFGVLVDFREKLYQQLTPVNGIVLESFVSQGDLQLGGTHDFSSCHLQQDHTLTMLPQQPLNIVAARLRIDGVIDGVGSGYPGRCNPAGPPEQSEPAFGWTSLRAGRPFAEHPTSPNDRHQQGALTPPLRNARDLDGAQAVRPNTQHAATAGPRAEASETISSSSFNPNHPYVFFNQRDLDRLRAHVQSGADTYVTRAYAAMKAFADATVDDSPAMQTASSDWLVNYRNGLIDTEKTTAWALCWQVERDIRYAQKTREFVLHYRQEDPDTMLSWVAWQINILISYDLTVDSGVYSASEISGMQDFITSRYTKNIDWCENDPKWRQNMSHWVCGLAAVAAIMTDNESYINRAYAQFKRRIDATTQDGRFYDFDYRGDEGLGYNVYSLSPLVFAAQAAAQTGRNWWAYENNGRSLKNCFDFLASPAAVKPGSTWIPSIYGNGQEGTNSQTTGEYGATLPPKVLSDQRFIFEAAQYNIPDPAYEAILNDTSDGHNPREDLYDYHAHYWMGAFLNVPDGTPPPPTPPPAPQNLKVD